MPRDPTAHRRREVIAKLQGVQLEELTLSDPEGQQALDVIRAQAVNVFDLNTRAPSEQFNKWFFEDWSQVPTLAKEFMRNGNEEEYTQMVMQLIVNASAPVKVQSCAFGPIMSGVSLAISAPTGTGKTIAYALPAACNALREYVGSTEKRASKFRVKLYAKCSGIASPLVLVMVPTRELAEQIHRIFQALFDKLDGGTVKVGVVFGGGREKREYEVMPASKKSFEAKTMADTQVLVATPGRLLDLLERQKITLSELSTFVLDEYDRLGSSSLSAQIEAIGEYIPADVQHVFVTATFKADVASLLGDCGKQFYAVHTERDTGVATTVHETFVAFESNVDVKKFEELKSIVMLKEMQKKKLLVFCRTRCRVDELWNKLTELGINAMMVHGGLPQDDRSIIIEAFRATVEPAILIATDLLGFGLDTRRTTVVQFDLPVDYETYASRAGRSGRGGVLGDCISYYDAQRNANLAADIVKHIEPALINSLPAIIKQQARARVPKCTLYR